ncbi:F-box protein SKIP8-like isoform X2 [Salvia splendens]|uniref:F-box protein SKIP8-like isoform X2 n=1 Tax=Salvia splendens TaxID=180675 RepID=UPI001C255F56|nr:F-box protein SKIP8-like isoform X2 [Salvia splendens]
MQNHIFFCFTSSAVVFRRVKLGLSCSDCEREIGGVEMAVQVNEGATENGGVDVEMTGQVNGGATENGVERQSGASMIEQLMPEITAHALSYLDYQSLCRLSMTNSHMRKAADDDNAWKALYHKDFTLEQDNVTPPNGWKAYYAATRAVVTVNAEFFRIVRERLVQAMRQIWLQADYVKCFRANGDSFSGYNAVVGSWQISLDRENVAAFEIQDVRVRVMSNMAWVTMKVYPDILTGLFNVTNVYELHDGRWYMVHHHCSAYVRLGGGGHGQGLLPVLV